MGWPLRPRAAGFGRADDDPFGLEFEVEATEGHARRFVRFFDPNCYLYLSRSMDWFDWPNTPTAM